MNTRLGGERGDDNVSAVVILGALLVLTWAVLQVVVVHLGRNVALEAARDGVNEARLLPVDTAAAERRALDYVQLVTVGWLSNVSAMATSDGEQVTVTVAADAASLLPFARLSVSQTASAPIERLP
ncbi:hypothetical protein [Amycolatopsis magusensis]|uniref:hypothetical protein n=1 Tax=Amycolatopsis magusensis TaxID=882444 RepID=UPI0037B65372